MHLNLDRAEGGAPPEELNKLCNIAKFSRIGKLMAHTAQLTVATADDMELVGARLAAALPKGIVIYLQGELGTGKTTLVRGLLHSLGYQGPIRSPTYTLVEPYLDKEVHVYHLDLYRLSDAEELEYLGVRDFLTEETVCLVEWPERGAGLLPPPDLQIDFAYVNEGRLLTLRAAEARGMALIARLRNNASK